MNTEDRIRWCIEQAEEIERDLPPQTDPHEWTGAGLIALALRHIAERMNEQGA